MIIDRILDRKDSAKYGDTYSPKCFYCEMIVCGGYYGDKISAAMDYGTDDDVRAALCEYIDDNEYNPLIKDYVNSLPWLFAPHISAEINAAIRFDVENEIQRRMAEIAAKA